MSEGGSFQADFPGRRVRALGSGEVVRVKVGPLAGATGVVVRIVDDQRCVVTIDGVDEAVRFILLAGWLEPGEPPSR